MKKMMITWILLAISLVGTLTYIGLRFQNSVKKYRVLESDLVEAADAYVQVSNIVLNAGESIKIETKKLIDADCLITAEVSDDICTGYVMVKKDFNKYDYKAYIKCENYETLDYEKNE